MAKSKTSIFSLMVTETQTGQRYLRSKVDLKKRKPLGVSQGGIFSSVLKPPPPKDTNN